MAQVYLYVYTYVYNQVAVFGCVWKWLVPNGQ